MGRLTGVVLVGLAVLVPREAVGQRTSTPTIGVEELVRESLVRHPSTNAVRSRHRMLREVPSRVGSLPDPLFISSVQNVRIDDFGLSGHPMTGILVGAVQGLPFPGKLRLRRSAAERAADAAAERIVAVKNAIELRVRVRYWQLRYAERANALVQQSRGALNTLTNVVHARYGVGQGAQQDALQAQVALSRLTARLQQLTQERTSAQRALNAAVGRSPAANLGPTRAPRVARPLLARDQLIRIATRRNPDLRVANARIRSALASVKAFDRDRLPDFSVGLGYRLRASAPGDLSRGADMVSLTLSMTLPVWAGSKQNARVRQARQLVSARRYDAASLSLQVHNLVSVTIDEIKRLKRQIKLYEKTLLPAADRALNASIGDYQVGRVQFVSVLENWRIQLDVKLELARLRTNLSSRLARLRALCGGKVERKP